MNFELTKTELAEHPFWDGFYPLIVKKATGRGYDDVRNIDCRKVNTTPDIQEIWFAMFKELQAPEFELASMLLMYGPKSCLEGERLVELLPGAITFNDGTVFPVEEEK